MLTVRNISTVALLYVIFSFFQKNEVYGQQNMGMENYTIQALSDTVTIKPGQFAFNSITVNNTSTQNITLGMRFVLPSGWGFVTPPNASIEIKRGEFVSIPFRLSPSRGALGDVNYPILVYFKNPISGKETYVTFFVKIKQNTNWKASLIQSNLIIEEKDSLSKFQVKIKNNGNKRELFEVSLKSDLKLSLPSSGTQVMLWPGKDTTMIVYVASRFKTSNANTVSFFIKARNETIMLTGNVYFTSEVYQGNKTRFGTLPIDFEFFTINAFGRSSGYYFFDLNGTYNLHKNRSVGFRFRTNSYNPEYSINTHFYGLNYKSKRFDLDIGSQNMFFNYQINGYGAKLVFKTQSNKEFEVFGLKSQLSNAQVYGFRQENHKKENRSFTNNGLLVKDFDKKELSVFALHNFEKKYSTSKSLSLTAGYSSEKKDSIHKFEFGYMGGYRFETRTKLAQLQSTYQYYSDRFYGILRGVKYGSHEVRMGSQKRTFSFYSESNSRQPFVEEGLNFGLSRNYISHEHGFRIGLSNQIKRGTVAVSLIDQYQENKFLSKMGGYKSAFNFVINNTHFSQSLLLNYMKTSVKELDNNKLRDSYGFYYQMKYKDLGINTNFTFGPNFYYDYLSFVSANQKPKTHNVSVFYEFKNKKRTFYDRVNISNSNNSVFTKTTMVLRNEIYFELPKAKSSISVFSNINIIEPQMAPSLNVSVKKSINVPMIFKQKYYSASIFLFKDKNNNDIFDKGEEPIADANIQVNGQTLKTNRKGMVFLKNVEKDDYTIDYRKIQNLKGWVVKDRSIDTLVLNRNISLGVAFKQSKMVAGRVRYELENSTKEIIENLTGILIVAVNKKGEMFRSTTNERGEFYLNLSEDFYNIQIPTNIFGEGYYIEKSILQADLTKENYSEIEFKVVQRRRQINIKKQ